MRFQSLRILGIIAAFLFILAALAYQQSLVKVNFIINGQSQIVYVRAGTVAEAIQAAKVPVNPADRISPPLETRLSSAPQITIERAHHVVIEVDGEVVRFYTHASAPQEILREAGITLGVSDEVLVDGSLLWEYISSQDPPRTLRVRRATMLTLNDNGSTGQIATTAITTAGALRSSGLTLYLADRITPELSAPLTEETVLQIVRSVPVTVRVDGRLIRSRVSAATVGEALGILGITIGGSDYTLPQEGASLDPGTEISVVRVTEEIIMTESTLPFELIYEPDPDLPLDEQRVIQPGQEGLRQDRIRVRYEDGRETSRTRLEEVIIDAPVNARIAYGTRVVLRPLVTPSAQLEYWRVLPMRALPYIPDEAIEDESTGLAIANSALVPPGSRVYIEGFGLAVVFATDEGLADLEIKVWYPGLDQQIQGGLVDVYLLPPAPENIIYQLPGSLPDNGTGP